MKTQKKGEPEVITKEQGQLLDAGKDIGEAMTKAIQSPEVQKIIQKAEKKPQPAKKPLTVAPTMVPARSARVKKIEALNKELAALYAREAKLLQQIRLAAA